MRWVAQASFHHDHQPLAQRQHHFSWHLMQRSFKHQKCQPVNCRPARYSASLRSFLLSKPFSCNSARRSGDRCARASPNKSDRKVHVLRLFARTKHNKLALDLQNKLASIQRNMLV
jgi:hypothetical protein